MLDSGSSFVYNTSSKKTSNQKQVDSYGKKINNLNKNKIKNEYAVIVSL